MISSYLSNLEKQIINSPGKKIYRAELICISKLVFYTGIRLNEINQLQVCDVVEQNGTIRSIVVKFEKKLFLPDNARNAIAEYYNDLKRRRPSLALRRKPLFSKYQNERTVRRHWEKFDTGFNKIHEAGIKYAFSIIKEKYQSLGRIYEEGSEQSRLSTRQYQAVVYDKKIRSGIDINDERCIKKLLSLCEQAERIDSNSLSVKCDAAKILKEAHETVDCIKKDETRKNHAKIINYLNTLLSHFC